MKKLLLILFLFIIPLTSFADDNEVIFSSDTKTIKELKQDLEDIKKKEQQVNLRIDNFIKDSKLGSYLKTDLSAIELKNLENIVSTYNSQKELIEQAITKNSEKSQIILNNDKLLSLKINLYKDITQFIAPENYSLYLAYIETDTQILKEQKSIEEKKVGTQGEMERKVEVLEQKIEEHKNFLKREMIDLIERKVEEKLISKFQSGSFKELNYEVKQRVLSITLEKINANLEKIKSKLNKQDNEVFTASIYKEIEVYEVTIKKIQNFRENLRTSREVEK